MCGGVLSGAMSYPTPRSGVYRLQPDPPIASRMGTPKGTKYYSLKGAVGFSSLAPSPRVLSVRVPRHCPRSASTAGCQHYPSAIAWARFCRFRERSKEDILFIEWAAPRSSVTAAEITG